MLGRLVRRWDVMERPGLHTVNGDFFWSDRAVEYVPEFKVASLEEGLEFGFECGPRLCFERTGHRLPFGCHAWARYDRKFWEPFLLPELRYGAEIEPPVLRTTAWSH
jgi:hypothetical protein